MPANGKRAEHHTMAEESGAHLTPHMTVAATRAKAAPDGKNYADLGKHGDLTYTGVKIYQPIHAKWYKDRVTIEIRLELKSFVSRLNARAAAPKWAGSDAGPGGAKPGAPAATAREGTRAARRRAIYAATEDAEERRRAR